MFIVSIGAGKNQIPLIVSCKDLGYKVIGIDKNPLAEGFKYCDIKIIESIYNYHEIYLLLKDVLVFDDVAAVVSRTYGEALKTVAYLCQQFKLPYIDFHTIDTIINKADFRAIAIKNTIPMPYGLLLYKKDLSKYKNVSFPCIVKPLKGHAKQSVKLIDSYHELRLFMMNNPQDTVLTEEYIDGDEIIVIGFVHNGIYYISDISDKILNAKPYFVDRMHILPSRYFTMYNDIKLLGQKIANVFSLQSTPLLMECIIKNNSIYLIEAACEFGGEYLADYAIPARLQYNIFKSFVQAITTGHIHTPGQTSKAAIVKYIMGTNGKLVSYTIPNNKNCIHAEIFKQIGDTITYPKTNHQRVGVIVTKGKTVEKAMQTADTILEQMHIIIE
ncbi:MAG: ATP-grasp domain-containing protein [Spirochaetes bacterium]|nr:ATP-grasp domain-containing protein [Spirochaetota bacterium]